MPGLSCYLARRKKKATTAACKERERTALVRVSAAESGPPPWPCCPPRTSWQGSAAARCWAPRWPEAHCDLCVSQSQTHFPPALFRATAHSTHFFWNENRPSHQHTHPGVGSNYVGCIPFFFTHNLTVYASISLARKSHFCLPEMSAGMPCDQSLSHPFR